MPKILKSDLTYSLLLGFASTSALLWTSIPAPIAPKAGAAASAATTAAASNPHAGVIDRTEG
jgi:hypothetical protein